MSRLRRASFGGWVMALILLGCATAALPPSEATVSILRSYQNQLQSRVASGHLTHAQARELLYAKLGEIQPPLPGLEKLVEFRKQVEAQVEAKTLTPEQAESRLASRESEMMARWEEMAAQYAKQQREFDRLQKEQESGFQRQQTPVGGRPF
ncbi:MAG TPA: hypothetical protein VGQ60_03650 [Nitrospiraceae bacterium]|nr:hypothetical protein [Nitrospiraceae bacterium]